MRPAPERAAPRPRLRDFLSLVKFSHSVFALPFLWIGLLLATGGRPPVRLVALVIAAAVAARTAAMAFNRWADRRFDAANPRTRDREIPRGTIRPEQALGLALLAGAVFVGIAALLGPLPFVLSPLVLAVLYGYSFLKRWTAATHFVLGLALALAPLGAWIAARASLAGLGGAPLWLGLAVLSWVAGFDVIYACQDLDFDRRAGLHSLPARLGPARALLVSAALHGLTVAGLVLTGLAAGLGAFWWAGTTAAAVLLWYEHRIVRPDDLSRIDAAFFTVNGLFGLLLGLLATLDFWL